jgi:hypothetical protein
VTNNATANAPSDSSALSIIKAPTTQLWWSVYLRLGCPSYLLFCHNDSSAHPGIEPFFLYLSQERYPAFLPVPAIPIPTFLVMT